MDELFKERLIKVMQELAPQSGTTAAMIKELFDLHNILHPNNIEKGVHCSGCRARVYGRMLRIYNEL